MSVPIESPYATFYYWLRQTDILSRTVSKLSQIIVKILEEKRSLRVSEPPPRWGLRGNVHCSSWAHWKVRSGLPIRVNWTFLLGVTAQALRANICSKSAIWPQRGPVDPKFQVEAVAPTNQSFCQKTRLNDLSCGIKIRTDFFPFCHNARVWQTDRRRDRILIARPRLHSMQRAKIMVMPASLRLGAKFVVKAEQVVGYV